MGVKKARGDYICFIDSDMAYSLDHLFLLTNALRESDMAMGSRRFYLENADNIRQIRIFFSKSFNLFIRIILGINYKDTQAGVKGFRRDLAKNIFSLQKIDGWAFDVEKIYLAKKKGAVILEIPALVSKKHLLIKSNVKLIKDSVKMFLSLLSIKLNDLKGMYGE